MWIKFFTTIQPDEDGDNRLECFATDENSKTVIVYTDGAGNFKATHLDPSQSTSDLSDELGDTDLRFFSVPQ